VVKWSSMYFSLPYPPLIGRLFSHRTREVEVFSCLVWSCEASGKAQTSIESPEICCFADDHESMP